MYWHLKPFDTEFPSLFSESVSSMKDFHWKKVGGNRDCIQAPVTYSLIETSLVWMALLQFWTCWAFLEARTTEEENIVFHHHTFPQAILQARGIVPRTSHNLKQVVSSRLLRFIWCSITYFCSPLVAVFSQTSSYSESYWSHWATWESSHQMLSLFCRKDRKLMIVWNCIIWPCGSQSLSFYKMLLFLKREYYFE